MYCRSCGAEIDNGSTFCNHCGANQRQGVAQAPVNQVNHYSVYQEITESSLPERYRPIGAWGYFGLTLLFAIPIVGFVFLIVFSFSSGNINRRNFARSYWCWLVLALIVVGVCLLCGVTLFGISTSGSRYYY